MCFHTVFKCLWKKDCSFLSYCFRFSCLTKKQTNSLFIISFDLLSFALWFDLLHWMKSTNIVIEIVLPFGLWLVLVHNVIYTKMKHVFIVFNLISDSVVSYGKTVNHQINWNRNTYKRLHWKLWRWFLNCVFIESLLSFKHNTFASWQSIWKRKKKRTKFDLSHSDVKWNGHVRDSDSDEFKLHSQ